MLVRNIFKAKKFISTTTVLTAITIMMCTRIIAVMTGLTFSVTRNLIRARCLNYTFGEAVIIDNVNNKIIVFPIASSHLLKPQH